MIVQIKGKVTYSITLDPTVWIFDDRKILLEDAFTENTNQIEEDNELEEASQRWSRAVNQQKINPPVNKSISRLEGEKILKNSYVMPIIEFLENAEIKSDAKDATLVTKDGEEKISLTELRDCYLLFAMNGKPIREDGPVHLFYKDGSNKEAPIKGIHKIVIN